VSGDAPFVTRLAPSPTGALHLGNARTFVLTWLLARQAGGRIVLRSEDLDRNRVKPGAAAAQLADLAWLGLDFDGDPVAQSSRTALYDAALERLAAHGHAYPCICSRRDVASAASAPHAGSEGPRYPGTCRGRFASFERAAAELAGTARRPAWRFVVDPSDVAFDDAFRGRVAIDPSREGGDFVIRSPDDMTSYQLAVCVDDAAMGITEVIRGADLLTSTPRQILLHRALRQYVPRYTHLPLVVAKDGAKLSKRRRDLELAALRRSGVAPERVVAWIARTSGITDVPEHVTARELIGRFALARLPADEIVVGDAPFPT
jgi:glutamyl-tRNA synthetase